MKNYLAGVMAGVALLLPAAAFADTTPNSQLIQLYTQLVALLQQELQLLQQGSAQATTLAPTSLTGAAPFTVLFTVTGLTGQEAIDFGDGAFTGSTGCTRVASGNCDLSKGAVHTYAFPGTYYARLERGKGPTFLATSTITVTK